MSDVRYSVEIAYFSSGRIDPGLDAAKNKSDSWLKSMTDGARSVTGAFNSAFDSVASTALGAMTTAASVAGAALAGGLSLAVHEAFKFNREMENAQIGLAAIASSNGLAEGMGNGMRMSVDVLAQMRKDARELPGEFKDLQNILTTLMPAGAHAGVGMHAMEKMAAMTMASGQVLGVQMGTAGREVAAMIEGRATGRMPMFTKLGFTDAKAFNHLSQKERFDQTKAALEKMEPAVQYFKDSGEGIFSTAKDNIRQAVGLVGGPLYEHVKDFVAKWNDMGKTNPAMKEKLVNLGMDISNGLIRAFDHGVEAIEHWFPIVQTFTTTLYNGIHAAFGHAGPLVDKVIGRIEAFMQDPGAFGKLEHAASMLIAARVGSGVLGAGANAVPGMVSMLGGGAEGAGALAGLAGPVAIGLAVLAVAAEGAAHALTDGSSLFHDAAVSQAKEIGQHASGTAQELAKLMDTVQPLADALGTALLWEVNQIAGAFNGLLSAVNAYHDVMGQAADWLRDKFGIAKRLNPDGPIDPMREPLEIMSLKTMDAMANKEPKPPEPPKHTTHIHNVEIKVNSNQDPSRIAKHTFDILRDFARNPRTSPNDPNVPFRRGF